MNTLARCAFVARLAPLAGPDAALCRCLACRELVESVDSHRTCADCAAERDAADEAAALLEADELNAWCDALREAAIEHQVAAERPRPVRAVPAAQFVAA